MQDLFDVHGKSPRTGSSVQSKARPRTCRAVLGRHRSSYEITYFCEQTRHDLGNGFRANPPLGSGHGVGVSKARKCRTAKKGGAVYPTEHWVFLSALCENLRSCVIWD